MNDEQWESTIDRVEKQFGIIERGKDTLAEVEGRAEWVEFEGPLGRMKMERTVRPRVVGEETLFSQRVGSGVTVKKVYDAQDLVSFMKVYKWNEGADSWEEVRAAF